ncbi:hypothetical protein [Lacrimispora xylanisolvens]|uniref:hypothetical protein n=1 Tax=Lacrimispora xylanisolvens TaxID=384636 RepID=UPI002402BBED
MKSLMKILSRYVLSAAATAIILLIINFTVLTVWLYQSASEYGKNYTVAQMAEELTESDGIYSLSESVANELKNKQQWAMLIDEKGSVAWSTNLPSDVPHNYKLTDVAGLSRWYLKDYPVKVWQHEKGLFVVGSPKKQHVEDWSGTSYEIGEQFRDPHTHAINSESYYRCITRHNLRIPAVFGFKKTNHRH